ncbi:MAG TPA: ATP-binding protein [Cyclobacteriaceae bacterium]|nr:ATP-binding protein [Cyclobacteriaceae bacterium]
MGFKSFRIGIFSRIILLMGSIIGFTYLIINQQKIITIILIGALILFLIIDLIRYVEITNKKLTRFLESIKYSDFSSGFAYDNFLGKTFKSLNKSFNEVFEAIRQARADKEENLNYLNTVVQHVGTGLLSFDQEGEIKLINNTARRLLQAPQIHNIAEIKPKNPELFRKLMELKPGHKTLIKKSNDVSLAIHSTELRMRGTTIKIVALQNIQAELQQKELEAWQNLTRVLRHEIMNSITPIASLTGTLNEILQEDISRENNEIYRIKKESVDDLSDGLSTIENRSKGLIRFVDAYRDYTTIPKPKFTIVKIKDMLDHIINLLKPEMEANGIIFTSNLLPEELEITADRELIEMILINLIKNAKEALDGISEPIIEIRARIDSDQRTIIEVKDNGPGIIPEAIEKIFIPFYTTKRNGSGIGLSLSRQIMQMHNGSLSVKSEPNIYTIFTLLF